MEAPLLRDRTRILALDVGRKRIGLALTDELGIMAHGLPTHIRTKLREDVARLAALAAERGVGLLLVGLPLHMNGAESPQSEYVRQFAQRLEQRSGIDVKLWDERLTSREAEENLRGRGARVERAAGDIDRVAAIILLESYLSSLGLAAAGDRIRD